jgi:hypothetical protein
MIARDKTCCRAHPASQVEVFFEVDRLNAGSKNADPATARAEDITVGQARIGN